MHQLYDWVNHIIFSSLVSSSAPTYLMISMEQGYCVVSMRNHPALWCWSEWVVILGFPPRVISDGHAHCLPGVGSSSRCGPGFVSILVPLNSLALSYPSPGLPDFCLQTWHVARDAGSSPSSASFYLSELESLIWFLWVCFSSVR